MSRLPPPTLGRSLCARTHRGFARGRRTRVASRSARAVSGSGERHGRGNVRLHRHRGGLGRLRGGGARCPKIGPLPGAAAGGRPARQLSLDSRPHRLPQALHPRRLQLEVRERARRRPQRPHLLSAARQDARRHQLAQRHGLHARHAGRLRRLAPARLRGLGLRERAALLPQGRGPGARRERVPRRRRAAQGERQPLSQRDHRRRYRGGRAGGHPAQRGLQRSDPGWRRLLPVDRRQRSAVERGGRLSEARARPEEPRRHDRTRTPPACLSRTAARWASSTARRRASRRRAPGAR